MYHLYCDKRKGYEEMDKRIIAKELYRIAKELMAYDNQRHLDVQDDIWAIELAQSSMSLLYNYLSTHLDGTNRNPWKDSELTNSRNEIKDCINKAKGKEVKKLLDDILKSYMKIKNEKQSMQEGIERIKKIAPKTNELLKKYRDEEKRLQNEWKKSNQKKN